MTVMVQKEVAQRICAAAGSSDYSAFSIYVQYHAEARILFDVPAGCFVPQPKVDSAVIRLTPRETPAVAVRNEKAVFRDCPRCLQSAPQNTGERNSTRVGQDSINKDEILPLVTSCGLDVRVRGEHLTIAEYGALADAAERLLQSKQQ